MALLSFLPSQSKRNPKATMEPVSLVADVLSGLASLIMTAIQTYERLERQPTEHRHLALGYKQSLVTLRSDVNHISNAFSTIVQHGNESTINKLLGSSEGEAAYRQLRETLNSIECHVKREMGAVDVLITNLSKKVNVKKLAYLDALFSNASRREAIIKESFAGVNSARQALEHCKSALQSDYKHFYGLYTIFLDSERVRNAREDDCAHTSRPSSPLRRCCSFTKEDPSETTGLDNLFHSMRHEFRSQPFQMGAHEWGLSSSLAEKAKASLIGSDAIDQWEDRLTALMTTEGVRWVNEVITVGQDQNTAAYCQSAYSKVLSSVTACLSPLAQGSNASPPNGQCDVPTPLDDIWYGLNEVLCRRQTNKVSIAFCGMVKAGKSLLLNALIGRVLLPTDELPSTAWPCRVQHIEGQTTPSLIVNPAPFQKVIEQLREKKIGDILANFDPPTYDGTQRNMFSDALEECSESGKPFAQDTASLDIYEMWSGLHPMTKANLLNFEKPEFRLAASAAGEEGVRKLLGEVNDLIRLCRAFKIDLRSCENQWPTMQVEFESFKSTKVSSHGTTIFEFVDIPGLGEGFSEFDFEEMVKSVVKGLDIVIPIISFKEVSREDWRSIPRLIQTSFGKAPDLVVCSHLDQYMDSSTQLRSTVASVFFKSDPAKVSSVLACSSRLGLSSRLILRQSEHAKPKFSDLWDGNRFEQYATEVILGQGSPEKSYNEYDHDDWLSKVRTQFSRSGLEAALGRIVSEVVQRAREQRLSEDTRLLLRPIRKAIVYQRRTIYNIIYTQKQHEEARQNFELVKCTCKNVLESWSADIKRAELATEGKIKCLCNVLVDVSKAFSANAVSGAKIRVPHLSPTKVDNGLAVFETIDNVERFLQEARNLIRKSLTDVKAQFVPSVRVCASSASKNLLENLLKNLVDSIGDASSELVGIKEDISQELSDNNSAIDTIIMSSIKNRVMTKIKKRGELPTFQKKFTEKSPTDFETMEETERGEALNGLGFMVRAPAAIIANVHSALRAGVWRFVKQQTRYVVRINDTVDLLDAEIVRPFVDSLCDEAHRTLHSVLGKTSEVGRTVVDDAVRRAEMRFNKRKGSAGSSPVDLMSALTTLASLHAAEGSLTSIQERLGTASTVRA